MDCKITNYLTRTGKLTIEFFGVVCPPLLYYTEKRYVIFIRVSNVEHQTFTSQKTVFEFKKGKKRTIVNKIKQFLSVYIGRKWVSVQNHHFSSVS